MSMILLPLDSDLEVALLCDAVMEYAINHPGSDYAATIAILRRRIASASQAVGIDCYEPVEHNSKESA